jgi:hypothetical protein
MVGASYASGNETSEEVRERKFKKLGIKAEQFEECLGNIMAVADNEICQNLPRQYSTESTCIKKSVIETITDEDDDNDGAVQFYSQDIEKEYAIELLLDVADKWVTIRFCLAFGWLQDMRKFQSMALQTDLYRKVNPPTQASKRMMRETQTITANHLVFLLFYVISLVVVYHLYRILLLTVLCTLPPYAHYYSFCCLYRCLLPSRYIRLRH